MPTLTSRPHPTAPAERHRPIEPKPSWYWLTSIYLDSSYLLITTIVGAVLQLVLFFIAYAWLTEQFPDLRNGYFALIVSFAIVVYFGHIVYSRIPLLQRMMALTQGSDDTTSVTVESIFSGEVDEPPPA